jgi:hypothetical protein
LVLHPGAARRVEPGVSRDGQSFDLPGLRGHARGAGCLMFLLHLTYATGAVQTMTFESAFRRALAMITLASHPVVLRVE